MRGKNEKRELIINSETGEYKEKRSYVDNIYSQKGYIFRYNSSYIKSFFDIGLPKECNLTDCGKFYRLIKYIIGENQLLGYRADKIKPLDIKKISNIFNCERRQAQRFVQKMKNLGIIKEVEIDGTRWYAINPLYALKSKYLSLTAFIIFQEELTSMLPEWAIKKFLLEATEIETRIKINK